MPRKTFKLNGTDIGLDARPDRLDLRDLPYRPPVVNLPAMFPDNLQEQLPAFVQTGLILQQGAEGACTGFGLAAVINYLRWTDACRRGETFTEKERVSQRMLYQLARFYDEWQGEDYEGSSCRGALKGWQRHGVCLELKWQYIPGSYVAPDQDWSTDAIKRPLGIYYRIQRDAVVDMQAAIYQTGAIYVSANVHDGWMLSSNGNKKRSPNRMELPIIKQKRSSGSAGGHAFAIVGYNQEGFIVQNSWGTEWGWNGFAILPYDDWVEHGSDAWVVSLGVPVNRNAGPAMDGVPQAAPEYYVSGSTRWRVEGAGIDWFGRLADPLATRSDVWDKKNAYWHALVTGNDGTLINRIPEAENAPECVKLVSYQQPKDWFEKNIGDKTWNLAIYAHGGLVEEETSVRGIRVLGPKFEENQIYPVFVTWRSGLSEVLGQIILDDVKKIFGQIQAPPLGLREAAIEAWDRAVEAAARLSARNIWMQMKQNVAESVDSGHGLDALASQIAALDHASNGKLKIHLAGHSAGSFICGQLLMALIKKGLSVATCTLFAPACDLKFALEHFGVAINQGCLDRNEFRIHALSDRIEREDTAGPYRKSLLYLVSRSLERWHKTPLLGLATVFDSKYATADTWYPDTLQAVQDWQRFFWNDTKNPQIPGFSEKGQDLHSETLILEDSKWTRTGTGGPRIKSGHGAFDNSAIHITQMLERMHGSTLVHPLGRLDL